MLYLTQKSFIRSGIWAGLLVTLLYAIIFSALYLYIGRISFYSSKILFSVSYLAWAVLLPLLAYKVGKNAPEGRFIKSVITFFVGYIFTPWVIFYLTSLFYQDIESEFFVFHFFNLVPLLPLFPNDLIEISWPFPLFVGPIVSFIVLILPSILFGFFGYKDHLLSKNLFLKISRFITIFCFVIFLLLLFVPPLYQLHLSQVRYLENVKQFKPVIASVLSRKSDVSACNNVTESSSHNICFFIAALTNRDEANCLVPYEQKMFCENLVQALRDGALNPSICNTTKNGFCYIYLGIYYQDISLCNKANEYVRPYCDIFID